jgi:hypothetical protein
MHANAGFQHPLAGDESWMACNYTPSRIWTMVRNDVAPIARPISHFWKIMMMFLFGVNSIVFIGILLGKISLSSKYSRENIIKESDLTVYSAGRKSHATCTCLHFNNVPVHNTRMIAQTMAEYDPLTWSPSLFIGSYTPCFLPFWLPVWENSRACVWHGERIGRQDQGDYRGHPEVPIDYNFSRVAKESGRIYQKKDATPSKFSFSVFNSRISLLGIERLET